MAVSHGGQVMGVFKISVLRGQGGCLLLQHLFFLLRSRPFKLGDLAETVEFQGRAHALYQFRPAQASLGIAEVFAGVIGKCAVVAAADLRIGRGLVVPAPGKEHVVKRVRSPEEFSDLHILIVGPGGDVRRRGQEPGLEGELKGEGADGRHIPCACAGVAGIEEYIEIGAFGQGREDLPEVVVGDEGSVPVHIVGADDLVLSVLQLVSVFIDDLRAVAREMEEQPVVAFCFVDEPFQAIDDVFLRCPFIDEDPHLFGREAEVL